MNIKNEIKFLKKLKREYRHQPDDYPKHVVDDLIDMGVPTLNQKSLDFDKHFINQIDNQINQLKHDLNAHNGKTEETNPVKPKPKDSHLQKLVQKIETAVNKIPDLDIGSIEYLHYYNILFFGTNELYFKMRDKLHLDIFKKMNNDVYAYAVGGRRKASLKDVRHDLKQIVKVLKTE